VNVSSPEYEDQKQQTYFTAETPVVRKSVHVSSYSPGSFTIQNGNAGLTSGQRPTEHQKTAGSDPASGDAHGDSCPVRPQLNHQRGREDD